MSSSINYNVVVSIFAAVLQFVVMVVAFYRFFTSKYGRWKKDLDQLAKAMQRLPGVPTQIEYSAIKKATNNFHETTTLGKGGFGAVYGRKLPDPVSSEGVLQEVAVKKFTRYHKQNNRYDDFLAEVSVIHRLSHKNIVPLIGWPYYKGEALLVYEYMSNGSLDQHLFRSGLTTLQQEKTAILPWKTRFDIVRDIATGLRYIHHEHEPMVLHRDIKASNIMLDSNLRARLGDFGIACTVDVDKSSVSFAGKILGARGYLAPEYKESCEATRHSDIYAFGVLVLEIVTGRRQWDDDDCGDDDGISGWVLRLRREGKLLQIVDGSVLTAGDNSQVEAVIADAAERMLLLGLKCTHLNPSCRPSMEDVVLEITKSAPPPDVSPDDRSTSPWLPPTQDLRSRKSFYSTAATNLEATGSSATMELAVQDSEEQPLSGDTRGHVYDSIV